MRTAAAILFLLLLIPRSSKAVGIYGMSKSRFLPPYNETGGTTFKDTVSKPGVYLIKNSVGEIIYVGYSKNNLYRTLYRHFQVWNDRNPRITYKKTGYTVQIAFT